MRQQLFVFLIIFINFFIIIRNGWNSDLKNFHDDKKNINQRKSISNILESDQRKIFLCTANDGNGRREIKKILASVFDDYTIEYMTDKRIPSYFYSLNYTHDNNIFVDTYSFQSCSQQWMTWLLLHFHGNFLLFSPESPKAIPYNSNLSIKRKIHNLGPVKTTENDVIVTYMQAVWWDKLQHLLPIHLMVNERHVNEKEISSRKFLIYANSNCVKFREDAIAKLSHLGVVDCNGKCQGNHRTKKKENINNTKGMNNIGVGNWWENSLLYGDYKFCFVMEHEENHPTYITEKILLAFSAGKFFNKCLKNFESFSKYWEGCIPVYHGPDLIFNIFNSKSFIFYNISDPLPSVELIGELLSNITAMKEIMTEPILADGMATAETFFSFNTSIGNGKLRQAIRDMVLK